MLVRAEDGQVTGVNEAFSRAFGLGEDRVVGRSLEEAGLWVTSSQREPSKRLGERGLRTGY